MIKTKVTFLEGQLFSSQSELWLLCSDWLKKSLEKAAAGAVAAGAASAAADAADAAAAAATATFQLLCFCVLDYCFQIYCNLSNKTRQIRIHSINSFN